MEKYEIWNKNWLSSKIMKTFPYVVKTLLPNNKEERYRVYRKNLNLLNSNKNGYHAEYHFISIAIVIEVSVSVIFMLATMVSILGYQMLVPHQEWLDGYLLYVSAIPMSLAILHLFKSFMIQILQARKVPYRRVNQFWYEVRTADLLVPGFVAFLVIFFTIIFMF